MATRGKVEKKAAKDKDERPLNIKKYQYVFLIVCEDQKTEPQYFKQFINLFPPKTLHIEPVGTGRDPLGVVERAIQENVDLSKKINREVDYVWVVFDRDDAHLDRAKVKRFNTALTKAKRNKFEIAYSNEVFELWLLLHLQDIYCLPCLNSENLFRYPPLHRDDIYGSLQDAIRKHPNYSTYIYDHRKSSKNQKNQKSVIEVIQEIGNESEAIRRAEVILKTQDGVLELIANPSTKVHLLVQEIRHWVRYFAD